MVIYTSKMKGTTTRPSHDFTHTRKRRYSASTTTNLVHCTFILSLAFVLSIIVV